MCGSGTTLAEASLAGITGIGLDLNPLSVLVAKTKCDLLRYPADRLAAGYHKVLKRLSSSARPSGRPWFNSLDGHSQDYLARWFSEKVLDELERVMEVVADANDPAFQSLLTVALSNILRTVSWQKLDDLRVRKEYLPDEYIDPVEEFTAELTRTVRTVLAFRIQEGGGLPSEALVLEGDATIASQTLGNWAGKVSAVITSPPYATALPYLDTDRLSIAYLGLLPRSEHRSRDLSMIGNREITDRYRREYWQTFERNRTGFPGSITTLIRRIHDLNEGTDVGFRRRNLPSLLAKYFLDMKQVLVSIRELLKVGAPAYVVVGSNHTIAGGERVDILTSDLLADLGESVGLELTEKIPMEMLVSRDIFRRNASDSETIVCFRRPQS
jgi:site-specific DNA-methyltransferase (cytosine-N4-specific)